MHEGEGSQCHKEGGDVAMLHQRNPALSSRQDSGISMKCMLLALLMITGVISFVSEDTKGLSSLFYLLYLKSSNQSCMGTLIAPKWMITAAHRFLPDLQVILNGGNQSFQDFTGEILPYEKIIVHPNFTVTSPKNDLMLIKLSVPLHLLFHQHFQLPTVKTENVRNCLVYTCLENEGSFGE
uniref:Serine protease 58-like n=1 Tax=Camelus bactrianus TaxID=9837 RepID=A0A9W3FVJ2_CAMBA|nr:serine protease 58-like [Camelus bactrianus]